MEQFVCLSHAGGLNFGDVICARRYFVETPRQHPQVPPPTMLSVNRKYFSGLIFVIVFVLFMLYDSVELYN